MDYIFTAALGGVALLSLADEIILTDIVEEPAEMDTQTAPLALGDGMLRTVNRRKSLSVRLVFQIRTQDVVRRAEVRDLVAAWAAKGGLLTTNTRPGQQLRVVCDTPPAQGSSGKWTDELEMTLTAYAVPYWEDEMETEQDVETVWNASAQMYSCARVIDATAHQLDVPLSVRLIYTGAETALTYAMVKAGVEDPTFIELAGMSILSSGLFGAWILMNHTDEGFLNIQEAMSLTSLMANRTPESSDDIIIPAGENVQIMIYTDQPIGGGKIAYRRRYL